MGRGGISACSSPGSPGCRGGRSCRKKSCLGSSKRSPWWSCLQTLLIFKRFGCSQPIGKPQHGQDDRARWELAPELHTIPWHTDLLPRLGLLCFRPDPLCNPPIHCSSLVCTLLTSLSSGEEAKPGGLLCCSPAAHSLSRGCFGVCSLSPHEHLKENNKQAAGRQQLSLWCPAGSLCFPSWEMSTCTPRGQ